METQTANLEKWKSELSDFHEAVERITKNSDMRARSDDAEDRWRRNNFSLTFQILLQMRGRSQKTKSLLNKTFAFSIRDDISRAHGTGKFSPSKTRPIIIKIAAYKRKERFIATYAAKR